MKPPTSGTPQDTIGGKSFRRSAAESAV